MVGLELCNKGKNRFQTFIPGIRFKGQCSNAANPMMGLELCNKDSTRRNTRMNKGFETGSKMI
eukprot:13099795-Ditylum_brightwellii.AAC.1